MKLNFNLDPLAYTYTYGISGVKAKRVAKKMLEKAARKAAKNNFTAEDIAEQKKLALDLQDFRDNALGMRFFVRCAALQCKAQVTYLYANSKSEKDALTAQHWGRFRGVGCLCPIHKEIQLKRMSWDLRFK
jgi:hypothetical protein